MSTVAAGRGLVDQFEGGLDAPICLTWELTYACNLACVHCLSSSGQARSARAVHSRVPAGGRRARSGCRCSTSTSAAASRRCVATSGSCSSTPPRTTSASSSPPTAAASRRSERACLAANSYLDVQISLDGASPEVNDAVRGAGSYATALRAMEHLADAGMRNFKISVVMTRHNVDPARRAGGDRRPLRRPAAPDAPAALRAGRRRVGRASSDRRPAAAALRLADGARRAGADRRFVLSPRRLRRPRCPA